MTRARSGVTEAGTDAMVNEVIPLGGGEFPSNGRGKLYGCGKLGVAVGMGRAVDEERCQIFRVGSRL